MTNPKAETAKKAMLAAPAEKPVLSDKDYLSSGITQVDLALTGKTRAAFAKGHLYRIAGRSSSGKTFICRTLLAEAVRNPSFDNYSLIYDDVERGALMNTEKFFGKKLMERLEAPAYSKSRDPIYSTDTDEFFSRVEERLKAGKQFIWVEDSLDSLKAMVTTKMGDGKAKTYSQKLRNLMDGLAKTGSMLFLISQTRMDIKSMFGGDITAGGLAPEFYSTAELWLRKAKTLKKVYKGNKYPIGITIRCWVKKNRISGIDRAVYFPFHPSYGIDDIGANVDFLVRSKHWKKTKAIIDATEFDIDGDRSAVIEFVEKENKERELQVLTGKVWHRIEKALISERKPRYS